MAKNDKILLDGIIDDRVSSRIPSEKRDEAFEYLAFEQILKDFDLSPEEINSGNIDGRGDGGIDGFYIIVNGHLVQDPESFVWPKIGSDLKVHIISCKHHDTFKQATLDALIASFTEIFDFVIEDNQLKGEYSESLLEMRRNLKFAYRKLSPRLSSFELAVSYASRGDSSDIGAEVRARAEQIKSIGKEAFGQCNVDFNFFGSAELVELHRKTPSYSIELPFLEALSKGERYVVLARLDKYFQFISDQGKLRRYLFDSNVRDFMGLNRVNEDIKNTLSNHISPDFWWLNNGVTILATSATVVGKSIQIEDIQIVNGLQTTESIYRHFSSGGSDPEGRCILVKVIVSRDEVVRDEIIRATNNQTDVEFSSLHATDKIQRDIEDVLRLNNIYYERRKNHYHNLGHTPAEIVSPLYLAAGYVSLVLKMPHKASTLRSRFMRSPEGYNSVFSDQAPINVWPAIAKILKKTDAVLESQRPRSAGTEKFLKNWRHLVALLAVSQLTGSYNFSPAQLASINIDLITPDKINEIFLCIKQHTNFSINGKSGSEKQNTLALLQLLASELAIKDFQAIQSRMTSSLESISQSKNRGLLPPSKDFIEKVLSLLPPQPWKPGLHKVISSQLKCSTSQYFSAVHSLIEDGFFHKQIDGVLYDKQGNVVAFDEERVNSETLKLHDAPLSNVKTPR